MQSRRTQKSDETITSG